MKISTLISSHNKGEFIERSIRSVCEQSHAPASVTACEDCSADDSRATIRRLCGEFPTLHCIEYPEKAPDWMAAYLAHSADLPGDYVHLLAADDYILPGFYEHAAKDPTAGVLIANVRSYSKCGRYAHGQSHYDLLPGLHHQDRDLHQFLSRTSGEFSRFMTGGTAVLLSRECLAWLRRNGADRMGPWFDSVGYPAAMWAFGVYYIPQTFGVFTLDQSNYGGDNRPAAQKAKERPGAEAFFAELDVRSRLGEELCGKLLSRVK